MSRAKIAPTLVYAHKPVPPREIAQGRGIGVRSYHAESAWRELRALLALESAVRRWRCGHPGGLNADEERVVTAHEKLTRVSGLPGRERAK